VGRPELRLSQLNHPPPPLPISVSSPEADERSSYRLGRASDAEREAGTDLCRMNNPNAEILPRISSCRGTRRRRQKQSQFGGWRRSFTVLIGILKGKTLIVQPASIWWTRKPDSPGFWPLGFKAQPWQQRRGRLLTLDCHTPIMFRLVLIDDDLQSDTHHRPISMPLLRLGGHPGVHYRSGQHSSRPTFHESIDHGAELVSTLQRSSSAGQELLAGWVVGVMGVGLWRR